MAFQNAVIAGTGELKPLLDAQGFTELDLLMMAAAAAIKDAGLCKKEVDGLIVTPPSCDNYFMWPSQVADELFVE